MKKIIATPEGGIEVEMTAEEVAEVEAREERSRTVTVPLMEASVARTNALSDKIIAVAEINEAMAEGDDDKVREKRVELASLKATIAALDAEIERLKAL